MNLQSNSASTCGYVVFRQPEHAAELLRQHNLNCAGAVVRIWESVRQPIHVMNIFDLSDYCLQKVFSYLDFDDLASIAEINQRFKVIAQAVFPLKYKSFEYQMFTKSGAEAFLKNFGHFIEKLDIDFKSVVKIRPNYSSQFELVATYCSHTLKKLRLKNVQLRGSTLENGGPIFARLRSLYLFNCELSAEFIEVLTYCNELNVLAIESSTGEWQFSGYNLPKLENISWSYSGESDERQIEPFLECNPQLKNIRICVGGGRNAIKIDNIFSSIANLLPVVESVEVAAWEINKSTQLPLFGRNTFSSLKNLSIESEKDATATIISAFASAEVPLEHLEVHAANGLVFDTISNLKSLKTLYLFEAYEMSISQLHRICRNLYGLTDLFVGYDCNDLDSNCLLEIVRNAMKLQRLKLWQNDIEINSDTYANLVKILQERPEKARLELIIHEMVYEKISYEQPHNDLLIITEEKSFCFSGFWPELL